MVYRKGLVYICSQGEQTEVRLGLALAGGARPRRIYLFESLPLQKRKADIPKGISAFLVRRKGLEPPTY